MFVDKVLVTIRAGRGGDGYVSFRKEKFVEKGGPDGGDGGKGGDIVFVADANENTLLHFRYKQELTAEDGTAGFRRRQHGKNGEDTFVKVPVGTQVFEADKLIADFTAVGQKAIVGRGGDGGYGNAHFKSSVRQAPQVAEVGEKGDEKELTLELKLLADVGLVGFPNAGKSTFLSVVSNAKPEIADYPFTTLTPNLGVTTVDDTAMLIADIPGLIEGASQGKGLGDAFLRHIERTSVLVHLIDIYESDVVQAYRTINAELAAHSKLLSKRPQIVALTKVEGLPEDTINQQLARLKQVVPARTPVLAISSQAHLHVTDLLRIVLKMVLAAREKAKKERGTAEPSAIISLNAEQEALAWRVQHKDGAFVVSGTKIEKFAARTNFSSEPGRRRLRDIMRRMGITHELERQGITTGDIIIIGKHGGQHLTYGQY